MKFFESFIYYALLLYSVYYSATLTSQSESIVHAFPDNRIRSPGKQALLKEHLPLQIRALQTLQGMIQATIDVQRVKNPLKAFKAACFLTNFQTLIASTEDVLKCLRAADESLVLIGFGATPALKQEIDQLILYLEDAGVACDYLKELAGPFQEIIRNIPNPELPTN